MRPHRLFVFGCTALVLCMVAGCSPARAVKETISQPQTTSSSASSQSSTTTGGTKTEGQTGSKTHTVSDTIHLLAPGLQMLSSSAGFIWGYKKDAFVLNYTSDAGKTWTTLPTPELPKYDPLQSGPSGSGHVRAVFVDDKHGYLAWFHGGWINVAYTSDRGTSWQETTVSAPSDVNQIASIDFANSQTGFLLATGSSITGATVKYLYGTTDGGKTWKPLNSSLNQLPHNGDTLDMAFAKDGQHGLMTVNQSDSSDPTILQTTNGGKSWGPIPVTLPMQIRDASSITASAQYIGGTTGQITLLIQTDTGNFTVVIRQNGANQWTTNIVAQSSVQAITWTDDGVGYEIVSGGGHTVVKQSDNAGATWIGSADLSNELSSTDTVLQLQMMNDGTGWLLIQDENLQPQLLFTNDGGQTFSQPG